jgi:hypothetical protein
MGQVCSGSVVTRDDPSSFHALRVEPDDSLEVRGNLRSPLLPTPYHHPTQLRAVLGQLQQLQLQCGIEARLGDALDEEQLQELQVTFGKDCSLEDVIQHLVVCDLRWQVHQRRSARSLVSGTACH